MDWAAIAKIAASHGAPLVADVLGTVLPFPASLVVKTIIQSLGAAFGVPDADTNPAALQTAINNDPDAATKIQAVEDKHKADLDAALKFAELQVRQNSEALAATQTMAWPLKVFLAGWRPAFGWICVVGLAHILVARTYGFPTVPPDTWNPVWGAFCLVMGLRSVDKYFGVAADSASIVTGLIKRRLK